MANVNTIMAILSKIQNTCKDNSMKEPYFLIIGILIFQVYHLGPNLYNPVKQILIQV